LLNKSQYLLANPAGGSTGGHLIPAPSQTHVARLQISEVTKIRRCFLGTAKVDLCLQGSINMINWCLAASQLRRFSDASNKNVMADIFAQKT